MTLFTQQWVSLSLSVSVYSRRAGCPQGRDIHLGLLLTSALSLCVSLCHCKTPIPHICILHTLNLQSCLAKYFVSTLWACVKLIQMVSLLCLDYDNSVTAWPILYLLGSFYPSLLTWTKSCTESPVGGLSEQWVLYNNLNNLICLEYKYHWLFVGELVCIEMNAQMSWISNNPARNDWF